MGTRSGDLDPSIVTYIANLRNHTPDEMDEILNKKSGVYEYQKYLSISET